MSACLNCGNYVYADSYCANERIFCSTDCKKDYDIKTITLNIPCHYCHGDIVIREGVYVKGKKAYCSEYCLNQFINNLKTVKV